MNPVNPDRSSAAPGGTPEIPGLARVTIPDKPRYRPDPTPDALSAPRPVWQNSTLLGDFVGRSLRVVARILSPELITRLLAGARSVGQYAVLAAGALTLLYAIFAAIKQNSFAVFLTSLAMIAAIAVAQFAATRFLDAADTAIADSPSRLSSLVFLECTGLLVLLFAAAVLVGGLITAIQLSSFGALLPALLITAVLACFGAVALHPKLVNVELARGSAGEEAIGLLTFFFKSGLRLVPLLFCLLAIGGCLAIIASFFQAGQALAGMIGSVAQALPMPMSMPYGLAGAAVVVMACLLPLVSYFVFLLQYLMLDVLRAILCVPAKLDALKR